MNSLIFHVLFALAFALNFSIVAIYRRRAQAGERFPLAEETKAVAIPLRVVGLLMWLYVPVYTVVPRLMRWSVVDLPDPLRWLGVVLAFGVLPPLVIWAQRSLGRNVTTTVITRKEHTLVTTGPYRWIRHPLYTFGLLGFLSLALIVGSWFLALVALLSFTLVALRVPQEEAKLIERFGDQYRAYQQRTGRFFPKLI